MTPGGFKSGNVQTSSRKQLPYAVVQFTGDPDAFMLLCFHHRTRTLLAFLQQRLPHTQLLPLLEATVQQIGDHPTDEQCTDQYPAHRGTPCQLKVFDPIILLQQPVFRLLPLGIETRLHFRDAFIQVLILKTILIAHVTSQVLERFLVHLQTGITIGEMTVGIPHLFLRFNLFCERQCAVRSVYTLAQLSVREIQFRKQVPSLRHGRRIAQGFPYPNGAKLQRFSGRVVFSLVLHAGHSAEAHGFAVKTSFRSSEFDSNSKRRVCFLYPLLDQ